MDRARTMAPMSGIRAVSTMATANRRRMRSRAGMSAHLDRRERRGQRRGDRRAPTSSPTLALPELPQRRDAGAPRLGSRAQGRPEATEGRPEGNPSPLAEAMGDPTKSLISDAPNVDAEGDGHRGAEGVQDDTSGGNLRRPGPGCRIPKEPAPGRYFREAAQGEWRDSELRGAGEPMTVAGPVPRAEADVPAQHLRANDSGKGATSAVQDERRMDLPPLVRAEYQGFAIGTDEIESPLDDEIPHDGNARNRTRPALEPPLGLESPSHAQGLEYLRKGVVIGAKSMSEALEEHLESVLGEVHDPVDVMALGKEGERLGPGLASRIDAPSARGVELSKTASSRPDEEPLPVTIGTLTVLPEEAHEGEPIPVREVLEAHVAMQHGG
jgi:hypothetical protein